MEYDSQDEEIDPNAQLPKKKSTGPTVLNSPSQEKSDYPSWEDLPEEQRMAYKSPMNYARKMLENKINSAKDNEMY